MGHIPRSSSAFAMCTNTAAEDALGARSYRDRSVSMMEGRSWVLRTSQTIISTRQSPALEYADMYFGKSIVLLAGYILFKWLSPPLGIGEAS